MRRPVQVRPMGKDVDSELSLAQVGRILSLPAERLDALASHEPAFTPIPSSGRTRRYRREDVERLLSSCAGGMHHHAVQFFDRDDFLCESVTRYLAEGFDVDAPMVVIARPERLHAFLAALRAQGRDVDPALASGQLVLFDAHQTLARFMGDGLPRPRDFRAVIAPVIERGRAAFPNARLRAYGEMVDILWEQGRPDAAIRLEGLWNELASTLPFSLLCGYRMNNFEGEEDAERFARVCAAHSEVSPAESCTHPGRLDAHRREVARLQQRIQALEAATRRQATASPAIPPTPVPAPSVLAPGDRSSLPDNLCVLVVDDDPAARRLLIETVGELRQPRMQVVEADSVSGALARIEGHDPDVCICDFRLSAGETALDLFRAARGNGCVAPFIGITANLLEEDLAETLLTAGFDDVVLKRDLGASNLYRLLRNAGLRSQSAKRLLDIGTRDEMTGALNRRGFLGRLETERRRCVDESSALSLLYIDMDNLKCVNDRFGHRAGDQLIKALVTELRPLLRRCDAMGRLGGDEFCVVLPGADDAMARHVAARLRQNLARNPLPFGNGLIEVRASVGIHSMAHVAGITADELVDLADQAMFREKQSRRAGASRATA
jgi:diguanylate cyclase (GGDEF)-like protein